MNTKDIGSLGEQAAEKFLLNNDYKILHKNWRHKRLEVDLICQVDHLIVFVEVKTRSGNLFGDAEAFVDYNKRRNLFAAADAYCYKYDYCSEIRFDVIAISITKTNSIKELRHFADAFYEIGY